MKIIEVLFVRADPSQRVVTVRLRDPHSNEPEFELTPELAMLLGEAIARAGLAARELAIQNESEVKKWRGWQ